MNADAAGVVSQIFGAVLIALLVEDRAVHQDEDELFFARVFMLGLVSAGTGLFASLPAAVWEGASSTATIVTVGVCLAGSLFALIVPVAHRLPPWSGLEPRRETTLKSIVMVILVLIVTVVVVASGPRF